MLNEPLIREVVQAIEEQSEKWNQNSYGVDVDPDSYKYVADCESAMCFAGWALYLSGSVYTPQSYPTSEFCDAKTVLGLSHDQAKAIFHWFPSEDKVSMLKERITEITGIEF